MHQPEDDSGGRVVMKNHDRRHHRDRHDSFADQLAAVKPLLGQEPVEPPPRPAPKARKLVMSNPTPAQATATATPATSTPATSTPASADVTVTNEDSSPREYIPSSAPRKVKGGGQYVLDAPLGLITADTPSGTVMVPLKDETERSQFVKAAADAVHAAARKDKVSFWAQSGLLLVSAVAMAATVWGASQAVKDAAKGD